VSRGAHRRICVGGLLAGLAVFGCNALPAPRCNDPGVRVSVITGTFGRAVTDATLTLHDGDYTEVMQLVSIEFGRYVGAIERPGTYTLTVEKHNYATQIIENIVVGGEPCSLEPVELDVQVFPVESP
jgi:6,7-dimethyl-8-ribityllumazine synthase